MAGKITLKEDKAIELIYLLSEKQEAFLPIFTDWKEVKKWNKSDEIQIMTLKIKDYQAVLNENKKYVGVSINPYGENIVLSAQQINTIFDQNTIVEKGTKIQIGEPAKYPINLIESLKKIFSTIETIKKAYLLYMLKNGEQSYLLVVDTDSPQNDFPKIGNLSAKYLGEKELMDLVPFSSQLGKDYCNEISPFYIQK